MLHFPILRKGEPYKSVDVIQTPHHRTREMFVEISQANTGLIRRDLIDQRSAKKALEKYTVRELIAICKKAGEEFLHEWRDFRARHPDWEQPEWIGFAVRSFYASAA